MGLSMTKYKYGLKKWKKSEIEEEKKKQKTKHEKGIFFDKEQCRHNNSCSFTSPSKHHFIYFPNTHKGDKGS